MHKLKLALLPGDGIGKDVSLAVVPVFDALNVPVEIKFGDIGWEFWKSEGDPVPERTWKLIKECDTTLLGAVTSKPEREAEKELAPHLQSTIAGYVSPVIQLRQKLDLYANVRPCFSLGSKSKNFNFCVVRENTEGLYSGFDFHPLPENLHQIVKSGKPWQEISPESLSCSLRIQSEAGLKRIFAFAFNLAQKKEYKRVTFADKPNVLRKSSAFARGLFEEIAGNYPQIKADILNIDAVALWMVRRPEEFGVIVAENMFGDILSDLGAGVMGGLGFAPSANIGLKGCYFEPVHGSAPRINPESANPSAMFLTVAMLLEHFSFPAEAQRIRNAVSNIVTQRRKITYDLGGNASTMEMAEAITEQCRNPRRRLVVSFLATGDEIVRGDIKDHNSNYFANIIDNSGGNIYQHLHVSDQKKEISDGLSYLLDASDAVVVTGGLGPTSDDQTRFAVADATCQKLVFDEGAWDHITRRLEGFGIPVSSSNRSQALFPKGSEIYPNKKGTAFGCRLTWQNKHIFMLPGPPNECLPLFHKHVIPFLKMSEFFEKKIISNWLTLGIVEGEITEKISEIEGLSQEEVAYCWEYPYLKVKYTGNDAERSSIVIDQIEGYLKDNIVSKDGTSAYGVLRKSLQSSEHQILISDKITGGALHGDLSHKNLRFADAGDFEIAKCILFQVDSTSDLHQTLKHSGIFTFECRGYLYGGLEFHHTISIPVRGIETIKCVKAYIAWLCSRFIKQTGVGT